MRPVRVACGSTYAWVASTRTIRTVRHRVLASNYWQARLSNHFLALFQPCRCCLDRVSEQAHADFRKPAWVTRMITEGQLSLSACISALSICRPVRLPRCKRQINCTKYSKISRGCGKSSNDTRLRMSLPREAVLGLNTEGRRKVVNDVQAVGGANVSRTVVGALGSSGY